MVLWDAAEPEPQELTLQVQRKRTGVSKEVQKLVQDIYTEERPGTINARIKDSYFAAMVFSNSEIRCLGYYILDNILKIAAWNPEFNIHHLVALYREFATAPADFLGYVGAEHLRETHKKIDDLITHNVETNPNENETREDFLAMVSALAQYTTPLNAQNLHMFP